MIRPLLTGPRTSSVRLSRSSNAVLPQLNRNSTRHTLRSLPLRRGYICICIYSKRWSSRQIFGGAGQTEYEMLTARCTHPPRTSQLGYVRERKESFQKCRCHTPSTPRGAISRTCPKTSVLPGYHFIACAMFIHLDCSSSASYPATRHACCPENLSTKPPSVFRQQSLHQLRQNHHAC